jgi:hypothetical protein
MIVAAMRYDVHRMLIYMTGIQITGDLRGVRGTENLGGQGNLFWGGRPVYPYS